MKKATLIIVLLVTACGDADVDSNQPVTDGQIWTTDEKADSYNVGESYCAEDGPTGCETIGAECCNDPNLTCQAYTVYDHPRCLPPQPRANWTTVQPRTRGTVMDCVSSFTDDGKSIDVTISDDVELQRMDGIVSLEIVEHQPFGADRTRIVEDGIANTAWGNSVHTWDYLAQSFYYDVSVFRMPGYEGVYEGRVNSKIADEFWDVICWEPTITVTARHDELSGGCIDNDGAAAMNTELPPEFIRAAGFGECMTVTTALDEGYYNYQTFESPMLAGSDLSSASMHFAHIANADLRGTNLDGFEFGYATISGAINEQTRFDADKCDATDAGLTCEF